MSTSVEFCNIYFETLFYLVLTALFETEMIIFFLKYGDIGSRFLVFVGYMFSKRQSTISGLRGCGQGFSTL